MQDGLFPCNERPGTPSSGYSLEESVYRKFDFAGVIKIEEINLCQAPHIQPFPDFQSAKPLFGVLTASNLPGN